jgi:Transposase and inactivated derivatives
LAVLATHDKPKYIRTDIGSEFTGKVFQQWLFEHDIEWIPIAPGHPEQNAIIERLNRTYRESVLDAELFKTINDAQKLSDQWLSYYNEQRPHQSLNHLTPNMYAA